MCFTKIQVLNTCYKPGMSVVHAQKKFKGYEKLFLATLESATAEAENSPCETR